MKNPQINLPSSSRQPPILSVAMYLLKKHRVKVICGTLRDATLVVPNFGEAKRSTAVYDPKLERTGATPPACPAGPNVPSTQPSNSLNSDSVIRPCCRMRSRTFWTSSVKDRAPVVPIRIDVNDRVHSNIDETGFTEESVRPATDEKVDPVGARVYLEDFERWSQARSGGSQMCDR